MDWKIKAEVPNVYCISTQNHRARIGRKNTPRKATMQLKIVKKCNNSSKFGVKFRVQLLMVTNPP